MSYYSFADRHNGPDDEQVKVMLDALGFASVDELIARTIPSSIRLEEDPELPEQLSENDYLRLVRKISFRNKIFRSYIGLGYYNTTVPGVIQRNILENPGWYTAYTPYQAEISQGRMEALLNFQTLVSDLTGFPIANASLLDEATAAAEAMLMFFNSRTRDQVKNGVLKFFVSEHCYPQTMDVLMTRAEPLNIELVIGDPDTFEPADDFFGILLQYPGVDGAVRDQAMLVKQAKEKGLRVAVAVDIMSLVLLQPPAEWGADCAVGSSQRFGVPLGYGGPHAAFFATNDEFKRNIPGRIIGVSVDASGNHALRMALQTREQHIKRDKATSNICTAQVLLAVMASMYAVYHGPKGLRAIAEQIHRNARAVAGGIEALNYTIVHNRFFDTIVVQTDDLTENIRRIALEHEINFRYPGDGTVVMSLDETTSVDDVHEIISIFAKANGSEYGKKGDDFTLFMTDLSDAYRSSEILTNEVFNKHHSETDMLRYIKKLENKDLSLVHSMIPLGSCTMKLNATSEMVPISWAAFSSIHPFVPLDQVEGYLLVIRELEDQLCKITGFSAVSLQPNSGAQGEYAGLMAIRNYYASRNESHRNVVLIPSSAHGTNPASAVMAGMKVVVVKCDEAGNIDMEDLTEKAEKHSNELAAIMITYPSTHGVYEEAIRDVTAIVHKNGGQVYMDGANMNAQVGLTHPFNIGADVCHLNLHKTFAIPHGGGGPGMGPIGVASHLAPFLPGHPVVDIDQTERPTAISAAPWGSASILLISYGYIRMMGRSGLKRATELAILNANYLMKKLEPYYPVLYKGTHGCVAHEMIIDCRQFKQSAGIEVTDIAKRLMDYGFHAPTVSFPVNGTLMVEPTESESLEELDRFVEAMVSIRKEIGEIESGTADRTSNLLVNSPHTALEVTGDKWEYPYTREQAAYPLPWIKEAKFWPSVKRVDNAFGDRNLICTCPSVTEWFHDEFKQVTEVS